MFFKNLEKFKYRLAFITEKKKNILWRYLKSDIPIKKTNKTKKINFNNLWQ